EGSRFCGQLRCKPRVRAQSAAIASAARTQWRDVKRVQGLESAIFCVAAQGAEGTFAEPGQLGACGASLAAITGEARSSLGVRLALIACAPSAPTRSVGPASEP